MIAIGPKAQAILQNWIDRLGDDATHSIFSPRFSERDPTRWSETASGEKPPAKRSRCKKTRKANDTYSKSRSTLVFVEHATNSSSPVGRRINFATTG